MEQARWERGISVAELARRIGVDRKRLWRVLNGERAMRADEFVRLCMELGSGSAASFPAPPASLSAPAIRLSGSIIDQCSIIGYNGR